MLRLFCPNDTNIHTSGVETRKLILSYTPARRRTAAPAILSGGGRQRIGTGGWRGRDTERTVGPGLTA